MEPDQNGSGRMRCDREAILGPLSLLPLLQGIFVCTGFKVEHDVSENVEKYYQPISPE